MYCIKVFPLFVNPKIFNHHYYHFTNWKHFSCRIVSPICAALHGFRSVIAKNAKYRNNCLDCYSLYKNKGVEDVGILLHHYLKT